MKKRLCMCALLCLMFIATIVAPAAASAAEGGASSSGAATVVRTEPNASAQPAVVTEDNTAEKSTDVSEAENTDAADAEEEKTIDESEQTPEEEEKEEEEFLPGIQIYVNGVHIKMPVAPIIIDGTTYVPLRAICEAMGARVDWYGSYVECFTSALSLSITPDKSYIYANGRFIPASPTAKVINGTFMIPARLLATVFAAQVEWDGDGNAVRFTSSAAGALTPASEFYNSNDLYWLSHIIYAEAGNQSLSGKIAVGNVIMNRVKSSLFPNTIYGVIFQRNQFTPVQNGSIYLTPTAECILAAKLAMEGMQTVGDSLFFASTRYCWANYSRTYYAKLGDHYFWL